MKQFLVYSMVAVMLTVVASCEHSKTVTGPSPSVEAIILFDDHSAITLASDAAAIEEASIEGDLLSLKTAYGGGCRKHDFKLYGSTSFLESYPVQTDVFLSHDAHGDACRALLHDELLFDLSPLKRAYRQMYHGDEGSIYLRIHVPEVGEILQLLLLYEF